MGVLATLNQKLDLETETLFANEYGYKLDFSNFDEEITKKFKRKY